MPDRIGFQLDGREAKVCIYIPIYTNCFNGHIPGNHGFADLHLDLIYYICVSMC